MSKKDEFINLEKDENGVYRPGKSKKVRENPREDFEEDYRSNPQNKIPIPKYMEVALELLNGIEIGFTEGERFFRRMRKGRK